MAQWWLNLVSLVLMGFLIAWALVWLNQRYDEWQEFKATAKRVQRYGAWTSTGGDALFPEKFSKRLIELSVDELIKAENERRMKEAVNSTCYMSPKQFKRSGFFIAVEPSDEKDQGYVSVFAKEDGFYFHLGGLPIKAVKPATTAELETWITEQAVKKQVKPPKPVLEQFDPARVSFEDIESVPVVLSRKFLKAWYTFKDGNLYFSAITVDYKRSDCKCSRIEAEDLAIKSLKESFDKQAPLNYERDMENWRNG